MKLADKLYNLRDLNRCVPDGWDAERVENYFIWAQKVVNGLRNGFKIPHWVHGPDVTDIAKRYSWDRAGISQGSLILGRYLCDLFDIKPYKRGACPPLEAELDKLFAARNL